MIFQSQKLRSSGPSDPRGCNESTKILFGAEAPEQYVVTIRYQERSLGGASLYILRLARVIRPAHPHGVHVVHPNEGRERCIRSVGRVEKFGGAKRHHRPSRYVQTVLVKRPGPGINETNSLVLAFQDWKTQHPIWAGHVEGICQGH